MQSWRCIVCPDGKWLGMSWSEENKDRKTTGYKSWRGLFVTLRCVIIISINHHHYLFIWRLGSKQISQEKKKKNSKKSRPLASAFLPNSFKTTSSHGRCQMLKEEMIKSVVCFWKTKSETAWIRVDIYLHRWPNEHSSISQKVWFVLYPGYFTTGKMNIKLECLALGFHITLKAISPLDPLVGRKSCFCLASERDDEGGCLFHIDLGNRHDPLRFPSSASAQVELYMRSPNEV